MKFTSLIDNVFYIYKIEKYIFSSDSWKFICGSLSLHDIRKTYNLLLSSSDVNKGVYRLIKCYDLNEVK